MGLRTRVAELGQFYAKILAFWLIIAGMLVAATIQTLAYVGRQAQAAVTPTE